MLELPEVEALRRYLATNALGRPVERVEVASAGMLARIAPTTLGNRLLGNAFRRTDRRGKYLVVDTDGRHCLVLHSGLTGTLDFKPKGTNGAEHAHVTWHFSDGSALCYRTGGNPGLLALPRDAESFFSLRGLGADALRVSASVFEKQAQGRRGSLKRWLTDQQALAGIGDVYADEILLQAGLHPLRRAHRLETRQLRRLHRHLRSVLNVAIEADAKKDRMPAHFLAPRRHRSAGVQCPLCRGPIERLNTGGRSTYFCPACQPEE